jgi:hypothetical protein
VLEAAEMYVQYGQRQVAYVATMVLFSRSLFSNVASWLKLRLKRPSGEDGGCADPVCQLQ